MNESFARNYQKDNLRGITDISILAGANSSGKSSVIQPLLLLKQTLEATYDPGALKLDGPNVKFTSASQFFSRIEGKTGGDRFSIKLYSKRQGIAFFLFLSYNGKCLACAL